MDRFVVQEAEERFVIYVPLIRDWLDGHVYETRALAEIAATRLNHRQNAVARKELSHVKLYALDDDIVLHAIATFSSPKDFERLMGKSVEQYNRVEPDLNLNWGLGVVMFNRLNELQHKRAMRDGQAGDAWELDILEAIQSAHGDQWIKNGGIVRNRIAAYDLLTEPTTGAVQEHALYLEWVEEAKRRIEKIAEEEAVMVRFEQSMGIVHN